MKLSSPRTRRPITTAGSSSSGYQQQALYDGNCRYGLWVPAFAGTAIPFMPGMTVEELEALRLALGVEHRGAHGVRRRLASPDHELKRRIIAFAGVQRADQHGFAL